jgi:NADPH:quinone reductase-like Zn-dependent oxidoreductase
VNRLTKSINHGHQIKAFGLNRMDLLQREGKYPLPPAASKTIMGVEFSGEIVQLGQGGDQKSSNGSSWKEGDEVFGLAYGVSHCHGPIR